MAIQGAEIILYVANMEKSMRFYGEVLGLRATSEPSPFWMTFDCGGTSLALHPGDSAGTGDRTALSLFVDDLNEARENFNQKGAGFGDLVEPHPGVMFCVATDPDGNSIFLKPSRH